MYVGCTRRISCAEKRQPPESLTKAANEIQAGAKCSLPIFTAVPELLCRYGWLMGWEDVRILLFFGFFNYVTSKNKHVWALIYVSKLYK